MRIQEVNGCFQAAFSIEELCLLARALRYYQTEQCCSISVPEDEHWVEALANALGLAAFACLAIPELSSRFQLEWEGFATDLEPREEQVAS